MTNSGPSGLNRWRRVLISLLNCPFFFRMPVANISATPSIIPEPQIPFALVSPLPMISKFTAKVDGSMRIASIAPGAARMPCRMVAPSKAGPVAQDEHIRRLRLPRISSPLVPTSIMSVISSLLYGSSAIRTATVSAPTNPAITGSQWTLAPGETLSPISRDLTFMEW